jgi:uncharacterized membrane protein
MALSTLKKFWVFYSIALALFILMPMLKYYNLHSSILDLGIFQAEFFGKKYLNGSSRATLNHFQPIVHVYAFIVNFFSAKYIPYVILFLQGFSLSIPIILFRHLSQYTAIALIAYTLFFPVWFNVLFDFHLDHLSVPILAAYFLCIKSGRMGLAVFFAISLATVKEPFALQTAMCGIYMFGSHWHNIRKESNDDLHFHNNLKVYCYSLGLVIFGFGYFYIATNYIIPSYSGGEVNWFSSGAFSWMGSNISEIILYLISHPFEIFIDIVSTPGKFIYIIALFGALAFIPLLKPSPLVVALPIFAISLLSKHEGYYGLGHQYTAGLISPMIFSFLGGLHRAKIIWKKIMIRGFRLPIRYFTFILIFTLFASHIAVAPSPIGRLFWTDKIWLYNYKAYIPSKRDSMIKRAITDHIPNDINVVVSIQNTINWLPLLQRQHFLIFPNGVNNEKRVLSFVKKNGPNEFEWKTVTADFVVLDSKRPWFLVDQGCGWVYGKCSDDIIADEYISWVEKSTGIMQVVYENDGFIILKRDKRP